MSNGTQLQVVNRGDTALVTPPQPASFDDVWRLAQAVARSQLFGMKTPDQAFALMMLAQAEGMHPMIAARDYDLIQGRPSKKAEAMLRDFQRGGGKVEWHQLDDTKADATFSHPLGGSFRCDWDLARAKKAGLGGKDMWTKYPRQMLRARCVSEGCKTVFPSSTSGMYTPEEAQDFEPATPAQPSRVEVFRAQVSDVPGTEQQTGTGGQPGAPAGSSSAAYTGNEPVYEVRDSLGETVEVVTAPIYLVAMDKLFAEAAKGGNEMEFVALYERNAETIDALPESVKDAMRKSYALHKGAFGKKGK